MIILDTNVISEIFKPEPAIKVMEWFGGQPASSLYLTTVTEAELLYGVELILSVKKRRLYAAAVAEVFEIDFSGRILSFDSYAANAFAAIASSRKKKGLPISNADAQIAGIASSRGAALATRNIKDFAHCNIKVINPWD